MNILTKFRIYGFNETIKTASYFITLIVVTVAGIAVILGMAYFIAYGVNELANSDSFTVPEYGYTTSIIEQCIRNSVTDFVVERQDGSLTYGYTTNADVLFACLDTNDLIIKQIKRE